MRLSLATSLQNSMKDIAAIENGDDDSLLKIIEK